MVTRQNGRFAVCPDRDTHCTQVGRSPRRMSELVAKLPLCNKAVRARAV